MLWFDERLGRGKNTRQNWDKGHLYFHFHGMLCPRIKQLWNLNQKSSDFQNLTEYIPPYIPTRKSIYSVVLYLSLWIIEVKSHLSVSHFPQKNALTSKHKWNILYFFLGYFWNFENNFEMEAKVLRNQIRRRELLAKKCVSATEIVWTKNPISLNNGNFSFVQGFI